MAADSPFSDADEPDELLRPPWADIQDETDADLIRRRATSGFAASDPCAGARSLPHTLAQPAGRLAWDDPPLDTLPDTDQAIGDALALARLLRRLSGGGPHPFAGAATAAETLAAMGAQVDPDRLAAWWETHVPVPVPHRRFGARGKAGRVTLPPLLAGARAAQAWMASGITDQPAPAQALLTGFGRLVRQLPVRAVFVPPGAPIPPSAAATATLCRRSVRTPPTGSPAGARG